MSVFNIHLFCVVGGNYNRQLLRHFIRHYRRFVNRFHVAVQGTDLKLIAEICTFLEGYGIVPELIAHEKFSSHAKNSWIHTLVTQAKTQEQDWCVFADYDEFHKYPFNPRNYFQKLDDEGYTALHSNMIERLSKDMIPTTMTNGNIWKQYPVEFQVTKKIRRANDNKIMAVRAIVKDRVVGSFHRFGVYDEQARLYKRISRKTRKSFGIKTMHLDLAVKHFKYYEGFENNCSEDCMNEIQRVIMWFRGKNPLHIIRVIWGYDIFKKQKFQEDFDIGLKQLTKHCSLPVVYYVYGQDNVQELKQRVPQAQIVQLSDKPLAFKNFWFHKVHAINEAHKKFDEILYLDFDCVFTKDFTIKYQNKLREKPFSVPWYTPSTACKLPYRSGRYRNRLPCNGFIYSRNKEFVQQWADAYGAFSHMGPMRRRRITDEQSLAYVCEQMHGVRSLRHMRSVYEPAIIQNIKQAPKADICVVHPHQRFNIK
jgi:hypothetical protein